jgi:hypothetical protein
MADPFPAWVPLNWAIIGNPVNWAIIVLMVLLGTIMFCIVSGALGHANKSTADNSNTQ